METSPPVSFARKTRDRILRSFRAPRHKWPVGAAPSETFGSVPSSAMKGSVPGLDMAILPSNQRCGSVGLMHRYWADAVKRSAGSADDRYRRGIAGGAGGEDQDAVGGVRHIEDLV